MAKKKQTTITGILGTWRTLLLPLLARAVELAHLETSRARLERILARADEIIRLQGLLAADRQELTKELSALLVEGQSTATHLRTGIKSHYGSRSERLSEFGLQPYRGRKPKEAPEVEKEPEAPSPVTTP